MTKKELLEKKAKAIADARAIQDKADADGKRDMTSDEEAQHAAFMTEARDCKTQLDKLQKSDDRRAELAELELELVDDEKRAARGKGIDPKRGAGDPGEPADPKARAERQMRGLRAWITANPATAEAETRQLIREAAADVLAEYRDLQADVDTSGGYTVGPAQFSTSVIEAVRDAVLLRQLGEVVPLLTGEEVEYPSIDTRPTAPSWTAEVGQISTTDGTAFGKRKFTPHKLAKGIIVSEKLLQVSALPVESIIRDLMAYVFAITEESAFMTGDSVGKPLGLFTASDMGIPTSRDVATGNASTSIQFDGLLSARGAVKNQYRSSPKAGWLFHRDGVTQITKLKDGEGHYIWQPSAVAGKPDMLLGHPVYESEFAPNTFTANLYAGIFGDFSKYRIVDFQGAAIVWKRHTEQLGGVDLSGKDQIGFTARKWTDGGPVIGEAFARVKLGA